MYFSPKTLARLEKVYTIIFIFIAFGFLSCFYYFIESGRMLMKNPSFSDFFYNAVLPLLISVVMLVLFTMFIDCICGCSVRDKIVNKLNRLISLATFDSLESNVDSESKQTLIEELRRIQKIGAFGECFQRNSYLPRERTLCDFIGCCNGSLAYSCTETQILGNISLNLSTQSDSTKYKTLLECYKVVKGPNDPEVPHGKRYTD